MRYASGPYIGALCGLLGLMQGAMVSAQSAASPLDPTMPIQFVPVDQAVEDLDPSAARARQVSPGLRTDGEHSSLFRAVPLGQPLVDLTMQHSPMYRFAPGVRAQMSRMDYLVITNPMPGRRLRESDLGLNVSPAVDGAFMELGGAGMIYDLRPLDVMFSEILHDYSRHRANMERNIIYDDQRLDTRLNDRITLPSVEVYEEDELPIPREHLPEFLKRDMRTPSTVRDYEAERARMLRQPPRRLPPGRLVPRVRIEQREDKAEIREKDPEGAQNAPQAQDAANDAQHASTDRTPSEADAPDTAASQ